MNQAFEKMSGVFSKYPQIVAAYLFGSVLRGEQRLNSDLDIAVLFSEDVPYQTELAVGVDLERQMNHHSVDLINLNRQKLLLQHRVLSEGKLIYCTDEAFEQRFREQTIKAFCDFEPRLKLYFETLEHSLKEEFLPYAGSATH